MAGDSEKPSRIRYQFLVSCFSKRTQRDIPSSSSSESSNFCLNDLQDLLIEVFQRLPTTKSAFLCKCVCKNWYSMISTPYFACRFITHNFNSRYKQKPSALIVNYINDRNGIGLLTLSDEPMFKSEGFELNYLPERNGSVRVSAVFNDLMVCSVDEFGYGKLRFYICNPFTMQWVSLPSLDYGIDIVYPSRVGFVCEPYYFEDSRGKCTINCRYRFRVVQFFYKQTDRQLIVWTCCSETQTWCKSVFEVLEYRWLKNVVAYNGKLLWYSGKHVVAYDPFNLELSTFIDCFHITGDSRITVFRGVLRLMELVDLGTSWSLAIWKLKDYNKGEWSLENQVDLHTMIPESSLVQEIVDDVYQVCELLGCDGDIVYLQFETSVLSCNMRTKELKMAGKIPGESYFYCLEKAFHIELPLWPTPIASPN
ncbi:unnamed protein product [Dovyalis caffra]|uniref:F-box domain-containing protein n=1 Tax=Dovyalis caffra TaxID=77055 RepID=A0AAV1SM26_9ROSI|nr:unnamed protein product [Dovyalis caffra]